jgi:hypothetical protein
MTQPEKTVTPDFIGFRIRLGTERQGSNEGEREREGNREANFHLSITSCIFSGRTVSFFLLHFSMLHLYGNVLVILQFLSTHLSEFSRGEHTQTDLELAHTTRKPHQHLLPVITPFLDF